MNTADEPAEVQALASEFAALARFLGSGSGASMTPSRILQVVAQVLPHASAGAITLMRGAERPRTLAYTADLSLSVDEIQYDTAQGPCLDALEKDDIALVDDLRSDERWPEFARRCTTETDARSILAVRLTLEGRDRAAMNLIADGPGRFSESDIGVISMFAPFVALSVQSALDQERVTNLETALQSSRQIGTAMGILMARELVTSERAFELLREASQHLNRKLRDIAAEVELTGSLPGYHDPLSLEERRVTAAHEAQRPP